jgi:hypothetical protein
VSAARRVLLKLDAEANLGKIDLADLERVEERVERVLRVERGNARVGSWLSPFRKNIGVQQPSHQRTTSRTFVRSTRGGVKSISG